MYECTICGQTKGSVSSSPQYDFRRPSTRPEERTVVGTSDHCSKCQQLTFFINLEESEDEVHDEQTGKNAPDWVLQGVVQAFESTSCSNLLDNNPHPPPKVPALQERHYLRKKPPPTTPTQDEKTPLPTPLQSQEQHHQDLGENPTSRTTPNQRKKQQRHGLGKHRQAAPLTPRSASIQQRHYPTPRSSSERRAGTRQRRRSKRRTKSMASKVPADSCCHFKDLGNLSGSKTTTTTAQQQPPNLEMMPIYPMEDMHMQQIARYPRYYRRVQRSNEESSLAWSLQQGHGSGHGLVDISTSGEKPETKNSSTHTSQNSLEHLQRTIEAKRKVMENLTSIKRRMEYLKKRSRLAWSLKKCPQRQCAGVLPTPDKARLNGGEVDNRLIWKNGEVDKGEPPLGERLLDVLKEKSGFSNDSRCILQREGLNFEDTVQQETTPERLVSIVQRCNYHRIFPGPSPGKNTPLDWPAQSQFSTVGVLENEILEEAPKTNADLVEKWGSKKLKMRRDPLKCPEGDCPRLCFVSGLITHILNDHRTVTVDRMGLRQTKTFFLDPNETRLNLAKCHRMFLLQGKTISSMGDEPLDLLPVLFMSVRTRHRDVFVQRRTSSSLPQYQQEDDSHEMLLLWLTTFQPTGGRVCGTLAVRGKNRPDTMMVATGSTYDLRASLKIGALFASPSVLIIPNATLQRLSRKRRKLIIIQAKIY